MSSQLARATGGEPDWAGAAEGEAGDLSAREAADALGLSERTIRRAIIRGELIAVKSGRSFRITPAALEDYRERSGLPAPVADAAPRPRLALVEAAELAAPSPRLDWAASAMASAGLAPLTSFVGRERELALAAGLLRGDDRSPIRLLTLTGLGGVGKTRLAQATAAAVASHFAGGSAFVPLAPLREAALVAPAIAFALASREAGDRSPLTTIVEQVGGGRFLLVLDNFEHLLAAAPLVTELLSACPNLAVLVTSRVRLRLSAEQELPMAPLPTPERGLVAVGEIADSPAVGLFVDRARAAAPDFALTAANAEAVAEICRQLDGLPLAIELAAARTRILTPATLLTRLTGRLQLLTGGPADAPPRLRTMRDAIAWGYDLLAPAEQALFRRLAVFAGGFPLEAAEAVGRGAEGGGRRGENDDGNRPPALRPPPSVLDLVAALVDGSLLQRGEQADGTSRFGMLATVREFGQERLAAAGEEDAARAAHADYVLDLIDRAQAELWGAARRALLDGLASEHDNVRAALAWGVERSPGTALRLAAGFWRFWHKSNYWIEGRGWLERSLAVTAAEVSLDRANALAGAGAIAADQGDFAPARAHLEESLAIAEALGDALAAARAQRGLGIVASQRGELDAAEALFARALDRFRAIADQAGIARCLTDLGLVASRRGDKDRAIAYGEEALPIVRTSGDQWFAGVVLGNLGSAYYDRGEYERGVALTEEALAVCRLVGDTFGEAVNLFNLGICLLRLGDPTGAIARFRETLPLTRKLDEKPLASRVLDRLAIALVEIEQVRPAIHLFGAMAALREAIGDVLYVDEQGPIAAGHAAARERLGEIAFAEAWATGRSLSLEQATELANRLDVAAPRRSEAVRRTTEAVLTSGEIDVLRLLVEGKSDKEIAAGLALSRRAASRHVAAILAKLGVSSRTAAATLAVRDRLV